MPTRRATVSSAADGRRPDVSRTAQAAEVARPDLPRLRREARELVRA